MKKSRPPYKTLSYTASEYELNSQNSDSNSTIDQGRRNILKSVSLSSMTTLLGMAIPFGYLMPKGLMPIALAEQNKQFTIPGKSGLTILNDRPINAETPAHLLDDDITPAKHLFVRNNGIPPKLSDIDTSTWQLTIDGEACERPQSFSIAQLKQQFKSYTYQLVIECGGNGRSEFSPPAKGNQWTVGAIGCPRWTGVRLADVLKHCGVKEDAIYIGYYGADKHLSGEKNKVVISRGVPIGKALEKETLIAWEMNGEAIPLQNGYPLRLVCGGWPASTSGKWLNKIVVRNTIHDGPKMGGYSYRVPCKPVAPGTKVAEEDMCIIESMPVKSLVTFPKSGIIHNLNKPLDIRGKAWAGDLSVAKVFTSIDFGVTWQLAKLKAPANRLAWQSWQAEVTFQQAGYYEVWARAVDSNGKSQPMILPGWNPRGYLNNACHRIAVAVS